MGLLDSLFPSIADWQARERQKRTVTDYGPALKGVDTMSAGMIGSLLSSPSAAAQRQGQSMLDAIYQGRSPEAKLQRQIGEQQLANARDQASYARTNQQAQGFKNMLEAIKFRDYQRQVPLQEDLLRARIASENASTAASLAARDGATNGNQLSGLKFLSENYQSNMKAPVEVADATQQISAGLRSGNSLGALAAVIKLAKILDPTSVVREGEVTTVQGGIGTAAALINEWNRLGGKGMTPENARQFEAVVKGQAAPILQRGLRLGAEYAKSAETLGVRGDLVKTGVGFPENYVLNYLQGFEDPNVATDY